MLGRPRYGKITISGKVILKTGLHIGASKETMEIGGRDSPVIRHPITREPYIPGSSLKGKLRTLFDRKMEKEMDNWKRRNIGTQRNPIMVHVCPNRDEALKCPLCRLFGSSGDTNSPARLTVRDCHLLNREYLEGAEGGLEFTEWKFENAIDRVTSAANPRQIERVPAGAEFDFEMVYDVENPKDVEEDLKNLFMLMEMLEDDFLGGHGSRGYGKVEFCITRMEAKKVEWYKEKKNEDKHEILQEMSLRDAKEKIPELAGIFGGSNGSG